MISHSIADRMTRDGRRQITGQCPYGGRRNRPTIGDSNQNTVCRSGVSVMPQPPAEPASRYPNCRSQSGDEEPSDAEPVPVTVDQVPLLDRM